MGVMRVESFFRPRVRSRAGAVGLMQILPSTGEWRGCGALKDPAENVRCGVALLKDLLDRYQGNELYALGAYNGGSGYVRASRKAKRVPPNLDYAENVLRARARHARGGCRAVVAGLPHR